MARKTCLTDMACLSRIQSRINLLIHDYDRLVTKGDGRIDDRVKEIIDEINSLPNEAVRKSYIQAWWQEKLLMCLEEKGYQVRAKVSDDYHIL